MPADVFGTMAEPGARAPKKKRAPPSERQHYLKRLSSLQSERSTWDTQYREIGEGMLPGRFRYSTAETNQGKKKHQKVLNPIAQIAIRTLAAGLMSGVTSPSRPWMRLAFADEEVMALESAKAYCYEVTTRWLAQLARTNFYLVTAGSTYPDLAGFGTHASVVLRDRETVLRFYPLMAGEFWLAASFRGEIDTLYRLVQLTVAKLVEEFGYEACSPSVQRAWDNDDLDRKVEVLHAIEPNHEVDEGRGDWRGKPWISVWMETSSPEDKRLGLLRKSGHSRFPALTPRWSQDGQDTYGRSPGMAALPTHQQLQKLEFSLALQVAQMGEPPVSAPADLQDTGGVNQTPGGVTYRPQGSAADTKIETITDQAALSAGIERTEEAIGRREQRIREFFFTDFWLAMLNDERATPATAEEVRAKKEERMLQLGPVLEQIQCEYLEPLVDMLFEAMLEAGEIPPPPQDVLDLLRKKGRSAAVFDVEYVSIAAAAQKALGLTNVRTFLEFVANGASIDPSAVDLVDVDTLIAEAARLLGINPKIVRAMPVVEQLRAARAKQEQAAEAGQAAVAAAGAAKDLGTTPAPSADNALGSLGTALAAMGPQASQLLPAPTSQMP